MLGLGVGWGQEGGRKKGRNTGIDQIDLSLSSFLFNTETEISVRLETSTKCH